MDVPRRIALNAMRKKFHDYYVGIVLPVESHSGEDDDYAGKPSVI